jgi:hypothetical protein
MKVSSRHDIPVTTANQAARSRAAPGTEAAGDSVATQVDPSWKGVYIAGGVCLLVAGLIYLAEVALGAALRPAPADSQQFLQSLANHPGIARATYGLFSAADFLLVPAVLGLYLSLKRVGKNLMLVATGLMAVFIVMDLVITDASTLTIVTLTQHAATAATAAQRTAYTAAAHYGLATIPLGNFYTFAISSVGVLLISMVMLKGVFGKRTAYVGIVAGIVGIVAAFYVFVPALALFVPFSVLILCPWCLMAGRRLYQLGKPQGAGEAAAVTTA